MAKIYLIICASQLQQSIQQLVTQKTQRGYDVQIRTVDQFGSPPDPGSIRSNILNVGPRCYLLVGDYDTVPAYPLDNHDSDAYYGMEATDKTPGIPFGRLSSNDPQVIQDICTRLVNYPESVGSWTRRVILTGWMPISRAQYEILGYNSGWECIDAIGKHFQVVKRMENNEILEVDNLQERREDWEVENTTKQDLIDAINEGALVVRYLGHGTRVAWHNIGRKTQDVDEQLNRWDVREQLNVDNRLPLVISAACLTGDIEADKSFAEIWQAHGKAIGILAADVTTLTYWNDRITQEIFHHIVRNRNLTVGEMLIRTMQTHFQKFGEYSEGFMDAYTAYRYLGDPDTVLPDLREDIIRFDPDSLTVRNEPSLMHPISFRVVSAGNHYLLDCGQDLPTALKSIEVMRFYNLNRMCFVGRPNASMTYFLSGDSPPVGPMPGEDCVPFDLGNLEVKRINQSWKVVDGSHWILDTDQHEDEARTAYEIIRKYQFRYSCFVGRPNAPMRYFRK